MGSIGAEALGGAKSEQEARSYAINVKPGGCVHRLSGSGPQQPAAKRRAICGWQAGHSVARAYICTHAEAGKLCRKCFRRTALLLCNGERGDPIEQFM